MNSESSNRISVGIVGLGTVGKGTLSILQGNQSDISRKVGKEIVVTHIGARRGCADVDTGDAKISQDIFDVVNDPEVDIVAELIGGTTTAFDVVKQAIDNKKNVVTANKALIAEHGNEIFDLADRAGVSVFYEAAVAGGIPIIKALREGLAGNRVNFLVGIINGTGNFILTEMTEKGRDFEEVLKEAQELGYAEADPTFDVEGIDAAHKLSILAAIAFGVPIDFDKTFTEGISKITPADLNFAAEFGYRIKHLGIARKAGDSIEMRVHPTLIPEKNLIARVDGVMNAVMVNSDAAGDTLYYGPGAGAEPTGSAVVADIIDLARLIDVTSESRVPGLGFKQSELSTAQFSTIDQIETAYYLRVQVREQHGVIADISKALSDHKISIDGLHQKEATESDESISVIIITKSTLESDINEVVKEIEGLACTVGSILKIRIEHLEG